MGSFPPGHSGQPTHESSVISSASVHSENTVHTTHETENNTTRLDHAANRREGLAPIITNPALNIPAEAERTADPDLGAAQTEEKPVTWSSLPRKGQLAILTLARASEPLTQTSLQAYIFYQLRSFDPSLSDAQISAQAGLLQASFTAAQFLTAFWWGRLADAEWMGRKRVLLIGLFGTCISCLGFGLSRNFATAAVFRTLNGVLNSNVGVMRTMVSEIIVEKKYVLFLTGHCGTKLTILKQIPVKGIFASAHVLQYRGHYRPGFWRFLGRSFH